jgi:hypothetical protein
MMYIFSFFFFLGPCIPAGRFVFTWIVQTLIIVYMTLVVYGQCLWLCIYGYVYGCVFMAMCVDVLLDVWMCFWLCVWILGLDPPRGPVHQYRGLPLLGARFHYHWDSLFHEAHFSKFWGLLLHEARFSKFWDLLLHEAHFHNFRVLLLHEAHFYNPWDLLLHEAHLDDSPNFFQFFFDKNGKICPSM